MSTVYYKATHKESGRWTANKTERGLGEEIWALIKSEENSEFMSLLKQNPDGIEWTILSKKEYDLAIDSSRFDTTSFLFLDRGAIKRSKIPVALISSNKVEQFPSVAALVRRLKDEVPKSKVTKMVEDPFLTIDGYSVEKL